MKGKFVLFHFYIVRVNCFISIDLWFSSQVSGSLLQTAQTWANAGVCSASCAHAFGCMFVCLLLLVCLFVLQAI